MQWILTNQIMTRGAIIRAKLRQWCAPQSERSVTHATVLGT